MSIIRRKGSKNLYMKFKYKKKQYLISCGTQIQSYAEKKERDFRSKLEKDKYLESQLSAEELEKKKAALHPAPQFKDFVELPVGDSEGGLFWSEYGTNAYADTPNTLASYRDRIRMLLRYPKLAEAKLTAIDEKLIAGYVNMRRGQKLKTRKLKNATINRDLAVLSVIMTQAKKQQFIAVIPEFPVRFEEKYIGRAISSEEERIYMAAVDPDLFDFALILMDTALEPGTVASLVWQDIVLGPHEGFQHGSIHGHCQKAETRDRKQPMSPRLATVIRERWLRMGRPETGWVFPSDRKPSHPTPLSSFQSAHKRMWKQTAEWSPLKIRRFRLYDLRHTALTRLRGSGGDNWDLKDFAGWKTLRMADRYVHPDAASKARAADRLYAYLAEQERVREAGT